MPIKWRLALVFSILAAAAFSLGGWLFVTALSSGLQGLLDSQLTSQLGQVDRYVLPARQTSEPSGTPVTSGAPPPGEYFFQVLDGSGAVREASADAGRAPLLSRAQVRQAHSRQLFVTTSVEGEHARLTAGPSGLHRGWVAVAGASLDTLDRTVSDVGVQLVVGGIAAVILAGLGAYLVARAALSPVERMRQEVAAWSEPDSREAIEVPGTKDEIAALARTMNALLSRLREAISRQRALIADAGHELRTPLAVLQAELELAGKPGRTFEELTASVHSAAEEATRLTRLANDLLLLARSDDRRLELRLESTELGPLFEQSVDRAEARLAPAGVGVRLEVPEGLRATVDPDRMRQVIDNLLENALRFAPRASEIVVRARREGDHAIVVEVSDSGPGFPPAFLPHAFERFRRPDAGRSRDDGGSGLGLAIVQAIATAHGGVATAGNRPEGGAVVEIALPDVPAPPSRTRDSARTRQGPE